MRLRLPLIATSVVVAVLIAWWGAAWLAAERKLAPLGTLAGDRGNYRVMRDRTVFMMDGTPAALHRIAGEYWVDSVAKWDGK